jgi:hypothetical protein
LLIAGLEARYVARAAVDIQPPMARRSGRPDALPRRQSIRVPCR